MKKYFLILCATLLAAATWAGDKNTVLVPVYITRGQSSMIPEKTDNMKLQNLALNPDGAQRSLARCIRWVADSIVRTNYESNIFLLTVTPLSQDGAAVEITSFDPMKEDAAGRQQLYGVVKHAHCYLIVKCVGDMEAHLSAPTNKLLLNQLFNKDKGKTKFERVFELVKDRIQYGGTCFKGTFKNGRFDTMLEFKVNGKDLLHPATPSPDPERVVQKASEQATASEHHSISNKLWETAIKTMW